MNAAGMAGKPVIIQIAPQIRKIEIVINDIILKYLFSDFFMAKNLTGETINNPNIIGNAIQIAILLL